MNIVIVGAGTVGRYIAFLLSKENHNVILIDKDAKSLEEAAWEMDIAVRQGSGEDWQLLDELMELAPNLFLAMTGNDAVNLVACSIAKNLGYPLTIARVKDNRYLNGTRLDFARLFDVDYFIAPEVLAANDIYKYMVSPGSLSLENFAHGAVKMRTIAIPSTWSKAGIPLKDLKIPSGIVVGVIRRSVEDLENPPHNTRMKSIFPHGADHIMPGDEVTFIGEADKIEEIHTFFGIKTKPVSSVVIVGGSLVGLNLAKMLQERGYDVRLMDKDRAVCSLLAEQLPRCTIINQDASDLQFLLSEKVERSDLFVVCTNHDEVNILISLVAKEAGCTNVAALIFNNSYIPLLNRLGISQIVSPRVSAANHILSLAISGRVTSLVSLYNNDVEIVEVSVSADSKITGIPLADLGPLMPKEFLIAMIQNRGQIMIANGARIISPGDSVIVITNPKHSGELEKIF